MTTPRNEGFTLLEISVALALFTLLSIVTIPFCMRLITYGRLSYTTSLLLYQFRYAQEAAFAQGPNSMVKLSMYTPAFQTFVGTRRIGNYVFTPGVNYKDGYLQMNTGRVEYDVYGNSQVGGTIRLVADNDEQDIVLYMGTGLAAQNGTVP